MTTIFKILFFFAFILALGFGFSWIADRPGDIWLEWEGQRYQTDLIVAVTALVAIVAAVMLSWWLLRTLWTSPHSVRRFFRSRKRDRGYQALSTGLIAAGAGNALLARRMSARARGLIRADQEPLIRVLDAQAALIEGRYDEARRLFQEMSEDPETRELGLRGLYVEANRLGAHEAARQYAETAAEAAPYLPWAAKATLEYRCRAGHWDDAVRLLDQQKIAHILERHEAERLKAVLLTAKAEDQLEAEPTAARDSALKALKLAKDLVPAAIVAAKAYVREDNVRKASSTLEQVWKIEPHPEIARAYVRARMGDSAVDRLKKAEKLEALKPNNYESLLAVAEAALDAQEFEKARLKAEAAARIDSRERVYLLLADIEEAETGDQGRIRHWMGQALKAPRDPAWVADGHVSERWMPISPVTGRLDAFEWKTPFDQLAGPIEEGSVSEAEKALTSLPPVTRTETPPQPEPVVETAEPKVVETEGLVIEADAPAKAAKSEAAKPVSAKDGGPVTEAVVVEPFFGRPPDDPGVKDPALTSSEPKTRLKLF
ncbi:heme biosynthesis protein HemY [Rhizobium sp. 'Codium 1']|uniref:heme biosynthesis protein HemY n=1 Tax=Rhizobium sp. 'Codium 1' TaxID=2940484 RepID=UPI001E56BBD1|nr:heme biosynthesis protein HemY [Rhizobium sp. 'Codium 1']MCC8933000.1 heme biosynthesis protein HemY [Rhizobium sp. 'Codium 1']